VKLLTTTPIIENLHKTETADMKVTIWKRGFSESNGSSFSGVSASHWKNCTAGNYNWWRQAWNMACLPIKPKTRITKRSLIFNKLGSGKYPSPFFSLYHWI
jgi:hypothetical protein